MRSFRMFALTAAVLAAPLAACDNPEAEAQLAPKLPRADRATALHGVSFEPFRGELSGSERQRLAAFVHEIPTERSTVTLYTAPDSPTLQQQRAAGVRHQLQVLGVPVAAVRSSQTILVGSNTVVVSAEHYVPAKLNCPDWTKTGTYDPLNLPHSNFGCANARNIADMVANPRDLEIGRTPGPASGHLGASAVDRLYNDKVKAPGSSGSSQPTAGASGATVGGGSTN
ncbi:MAG: hypothetical protein KIT36_00340 [Alphaproteobacteria bacterium]|nr:hypothetical protein [Alphaproteobacteria bacterium]